VKIKYIHIYIYMATFYCGSTVVTPSSPHAAMESLQLPIIVLLMAIFFVVFTYILQQQCVQPDRRNIRLQEREKERTVTLPPGSPSRRR
jgi:hypothetical protein